MLNRRAPADKSRRDSRRDRSLSAAGASQRRSISAQSSDPGCASQTMTAAPGADGSFQLLLFGAAASVVIHQLGTTGTAAREAIAALLTASKAA